MMKIFLYKHTLPLENGNNLPLLTASYGYESVSKAERFEREEKVWSAGDMINAVFSFQNRGQ